LNLEIEPYAARKDRWPRAGRHILAQFDDDSVVVYQAYAPGIGHFAAKHNYFGGEFKLGRMSWIKPNFLWMMYRCGWATKPQQEVVLAVRIRRLAFDQILARAVPSSFDAKAWLSSEHWKKAVAESSVRLQWDPDHDPSGIPQERRAIQLGLRGEVLAAYSRDWIVSIDDISNFVREQSANAARPPYTNLRMPRESVYPVRDAATATRLGLGDDHVKE
jgi:hypothetical protein